MKDMRTEKEIEDEVSPSMRSYRPEYTGEEDPNRDEEQFIQEALDHQEEFLKQK